MLRAGRAGGSWVERRYLVDHRRAGGLDRLEQGLPCLARTAEVPCRSRFSFGMSGDGKKLYIYGAGFEFDVYDAATLKFEQTWDTNNDITGAGLIVIP